MHTVIGCIKKSMYIDIWLILLDWVTTDPGRVYAVNYVINFSSEWILKTKASINCIALETAHGLFKREYDVRIKIEPCAFVQIQSLLS